MRQSLLKRVDDSRCLKENLRELRKDRASPISLEVHPVAVLPSLKNAGVHQLPQVALKTGRSHANVTRQLQQIPGALWLKESGGQDLLLGPAQENIQ